MIGFADETFIDVASGNGGNGCVSFRREKYVPKGGPDGGDGGTGGSVVFIVKNNLKTLAHLKRTRVYRAENGRPGEGRRKHGRNGNDAEIPVPPGTIIKDPETGRILKDLTNETSWVYLKGGRGGQGNWHFSTSRRQTPRYAQPGEPGVEQRLHIELALIADVGLVGLPNAGKSSLLDVLTNARPKVASYPFTTKIPNLGVMHTYGRDIVLADIPGIIHGASNGSGMGIKFLKHISRTKVLLFMIDMGSEDVTGTYKTLKDELAAFSAELIERPRIIVGTKMDLDSAEENLSKLKKELKDETVIGISSWSKKGLEDLQKSVSGLFD